MVGDRLAVVCSRRSVTSTFFVGFGSEESMEGEYFSKARAVFTGRFLPVVKKISCPTVGRQQ